MKYTLEGIVKVTAEYQQGWSKSKHISTDFFLEVSDNLDDKKYIDEQDVLTKDGSMSLTQCFVQGLIGNMHFANEKGYKPDAEHLRYIISELERGFASIAKITKSTY